MYSAAPTEQVLVPQVHSGLESRLDAMSLSSHAQEHNGQVFDEYDEEELPLGHGIEHACRCVMSTA